jgi:uncharacterized protein YndB with AHSA1/START domain
MASEYVFVDEWDVEAPQERVFDALADARTYPEWWIPIYKQVESDGPPEVGRVSRQKFSAPRSSARCSAGTTTRRSRPR